MKAKIRQQALNLNVHPDAVDSCVDFFVGSLETAKLATVDDDKVTIVAVPVGQAESVPNGADLGQSSQPPGGAAEPTDDGMSGTEGLPDSPNGGARPRAAIQINVTLDSSLDTDKLEKQLKLLRQYGAI